MMMMTSMTPTWRPWTHAVLALFACVLLSTAAPAAQEPVGPEQERVVERRGDLVSVLSGDIHVPAGVRQRGSVVCIGGDVVIEGHVTQDVVVIFGSLELTGTVGGQVTIVLSEGVLRDATVSRELVSVLGSVELERSTIGGEMINILGSLDRDQLSRIRSQIINIGFGSWAPSFWAMLLWLRLFHKFVVFVLLVLLILLVPERIRLMADEAPVRYVSSFFFGLLGYIGMFVLVGLLTITVVGIPLAVLAFYVLKWMGIAAIFHAVGLRVGRATGFSLSLFGSVLLVFGLYVVAFIAPATLHVTGLLILFVLKLLFLLLVEIPAVGLVLCTRFGGRATTTEIAPPAPQPPPVEAPAAGPAAPSGSS